MRNPVYPILVNKTEKELRIISIDESFTSRIQEDKELIQIIKANP